MASIAAEVRRSRRTLERMGMTSEEELKQLIAEQELDDTHFIDRPSEIVALNAPVVGTDFFVEDLIGEDEDGETVVFWRARGRLFEGEKSQHGTIYGYKRLLCRCLPCTIANNRHTNAYRARKRAEKKAAKND